MPRAGWNPALRYVSFSPEIHLVPIEQLASVLEQLGCPKTKSLEMAGQLDKRARQLAEQKGRTHDEALIHLLSLMKQGWAAQGKVPDV